MKKLFTFSAILVATGLLLPSCGTHVTIAKRQHSKGYYVDISKDKKFAGKSDTEQTHEIIRESENTASAPLGDPDKPRHVVKKAEVTETASLPETVTSEKESEIVATAETQTVRTQKAEKSEKTASSSKLVEKMSLKSEKSDARTLKSNVKQEVKKLSESSKFKKMESKRVTDGLSLFWIVILILLILWLLGLLGGLGWFIHIALVVALILLILWLLGVV